MHSSTFRIRCSTPHTRVGAFALATVLVGIDQLSKLWAIGALSGQPERRIFGDFLTLKLIYNPGAAFSLGHSFTYIITAFAVVVCVVLGVLVIASPKRSRSYIFAVIFAGGIGNLIDRLFREPGFAQGHVVDFINYNGWFIGNIADIVLFVGVALLLINEYRGTREDLATASGNGALELTNSHCEARAIAQCATPGSDLQDSGDSAARTVDETATQHPRQSTVHTIYEPSSAETHQFPLSAEHTGKKDA